MYAWTEMSRSPTKSQLKFHHSHVIDRYGIVEGGTLVVLEDEAEWCRQGRGALFLSDTNGGRGGETCLFDRR